MITDNQRLVKVTNEYGREIPTYDDGYGPLWIHRNSSGITGVVRARTFNDAYSICEDEFFPECDLTIEEIEKEYGFKREHVKIIKPIDGPERAAVPSDYPRRLVNPSNSTDGRHNWEFVRWQTIDTPDPEAWPENPLFQEGYGFRPSGANVKDKIGHGIYDRDVNADYMEQMTPKLAAQLNLTLSISDFYELEVTTNGRNNWPHFGESKEEALAAFEEWKAKGRGVKLECNGVVIAHHPEAQ